jgi:hypothetical protein
MTKDIEHLNVGTIVEYSGGKGIWIESVIYKISDSFVWFKGSGFNRIAKKTFENHPNLYRIKVN